jgi:hypothetical protein
MIASPFLWNINRTSSIFATDPAFKSRKSSILSKGMTQTQVINDKRKKGLSPGTIRGLSLRSEEALIANKRFSTYLQGLNK